MATKTVDYIGDIPFGQPGHGRITTSLETEDQKQAFGAELAKDIKEVTHPQTIICMDDRPRIALADGRSDDEIRSFVYYQWPGGLVLATTKAAVAADAGYLRGVRSFTEAYLTTYDVLTKMNKEDGGHEGCGASKLVKKSVAEPVDASVTISTIDTLLNIDDANTFYPELAVTKARRLEAGFFDDWDPAWHEDFLRQNAPQHFGLLKVEADAVHGHYADGLVVPTGHGQGFAKNDFWYRTGKMAFAVTPTAVQEVAHKLGGNAAERHRLSIAFADDLIQVSDKLIGPGLPIYK